MGFDPSTLPKIFDILRNDPVLKQAPVEHFSKIMGRTPFMVLLSTILSLRTKDETTGPAALRLFEKAQTPEEIVALGADEIAKAIFPVGFYKTKSQSIVKIATILLSKYNGEVPADLDLLLTLPGVGRKTANMVLGESFGIASVCVDIHVHRISNRWGLCNTKTPEDTENFIRSNIPQELWLSFNKPMVALGQTICKPIKPICLRCPIASFCGRNLSEAL
ncbi:MAG: endonuclease III domain-containing protein [Brevinema sp.]